METNLKKRFIFVSLCMVLVAGSFLLGVYFGFENRPEVDKITGVLGKEDKAPVDVDFSVFWEAWRELDNKFVSTNGEIDNQTKVWGAIKGLVDSYGDPYTVFMPPEEAKIFEEDISGNFSGVGMEIGIKDGILTVIAPLKNTPAYNAGIKAGDQILKIDQHITSDLSVDEAVGFIRGKEGTDVHLTVIKKGETKPKEIIITRAVITVPMIETEIVAGDIFVIKLYSFSGTSPNLFRGALREFVDSGKNKLILDLRGNPGGYLDASIDMASFFLPPGKVVVREDFGGNRKEEIYRSKGYDVFNDSLKMVILINEGSASASEILAGALQEHDIATLIGQKTFGKGSVQELVKLTPDTSLKMTVARWLTPDGRSISKEGLMPDIEVVMDKDETNDEVLDRAVEFLKSN
ncbi:MAG: S41 family peptidase [Patescibacteria group bacterium]